MTSSKPTDQEERPEPGDAEMLDWLGATTIPGGRYPVRDFSGGWAIRDIFGHLIAEGLTLREAIRAAMRKEQGE